MDVTIIFVNYKTCKLLIDAIDSLVLQTKSIDFEVIVVDNASSDNSEKTLQERYNGKLKNYKYISLTENVGFGRANNEGIKITKGRNIFFLNPDTILENNAIKLLSDYLDKNENVGIVGANLYYEDGTPQPSFCHYYPSLSYELCNLFHTWFLFDLQNVNLGNEPLRAKVVVGAALMIKNELVKEIGGFNPQFFMYAEENELCYRASQHGSLIVNVPNAKITHLEGKSFEFSVDRQKRQLDGLRTFYNVTYSKAYCKALRVVEFLIITTRLFIFSLLKNEEKMKYWRFMYLNRKWN